MNSIPTLVCVGPGFGKSALLTRPYSAAWLSPDGTGAALETFQPWCVAALRPIFPGSMSDAFFGVLGLAEGTLRRYAQWGQRADQVEPAALTDKVVRFLSCPFEVEEEVDEDDYADDGVIKTQAT